MKKNVLVALVAGTVFGLGLLASGLTDSARVRAFLDVSGAWDPRLLWVMGAAVLVFAPGFRIGRARALGSAAEKVYALPTSPVLDAKLVLGAVLFGMGWGIAGYCPGPALVAVGAALTRFDPSPFIFTASMLLGMLLHARLLRWVAARAHADA